MSFQVKNYLHTNGTWDFLLEFEVGERRGKQKAYNEWKERKTLFRAQRICVAFNFIYSYFRIIFRVQKCKWIMFRGIMKILRGVVTYTGQHKTALPWDFILENSFSVNFYFFCCCSYCFASVLPYCVLVWSSYGSVLPCSILFNCHGKRQHSTTESFSILPKFIYFLWHLL